MGRANIIMRLWTISHTGGGCRATRFVMGKQFDGIHKQIFVRICALLFPVITFTLLNLDKMLVQSMCINNCVTLLPSKYFGKDTIYCDDRGGKCAIILAVSSRGGH